VELSIPRPAEDPAWIDDQLAALHDTARDADTLLADQEAARAAAWERLAGQDPEKAAAARKLIARWAPVARDREAARSEVARSAWVARTWVRRAGQLTGHGDDLFFLELPETVDLLRGDPAALAKVPARRASYETYRALPPYPALIRGRFDPVRWAADPNRRSDYYGERAQPARPDDTITGFPGAAGVVEGTARMLRTPEDAAQLGGGEILVTTATNIGWTPVFPAPPQSSPTSARRCPTPRSWPANSASPPSSDAVTPPCSCTAATGSGSTAATARSRYCTRHDMTARAPLNGVRLSRLVACRCRKLCHPMRPRPSSVRS
jgi:hypothetical protein